MKIIVLILSALILLVSAFFFLQNAKLGVLAGKFYWHYYKIKKELFPPNWDEKNTFHIGQKTYLFPRWLVQDGYRGVNTVDSLNLVYAMPDFTSKRVPEYRELHKAGRTSHMLIEDRGKATPVAQQIENIKRFGDVFKYLGEVYGLKKYKVYREGGSLRGEFYLEMSKDDKIISYLECSAPEENHARPGCSHNFEDENLQYDIHYSKDLYLSTWQDHRRKVINFIGSFEVKKTK